MPAVTKEIPFKFTILTVKPEMFPGPLAESVVGTGLKEGKWELEVVDIRTFAEDKHQTVDDRPFGGGSGMVLKADVLEKCLDHVLEGVDRKKADLCYLSPRGEVFNQRSAEQMVEKEQVILLCGRYEGVDQRVLDYYDFKEVSIGDFVLSGGEIPAMCVIDTCIRLLNGVLGNEDALAEESFGEGFYAGLLEYSHYTRPAEWKGMGVPDVLVSGNHKEIDRWRLEEAEKLTQERRPDLWKRYNRKEDNV